MQKKDAYVETRGRDPRGRDQFYDERKKDITVSLTPTAAKSLTLMAQARKLTRSQFLELIARHEIPLATKSEIVGELRAS